MNSIKYSNRCVYQFAHADLKAVMAFHIEQHLYSSILYNNNDVIIQLFHACLGNQVERVAKAEWYFQTNLATKTFENSVIHIKSTSITLI